MTPTSTEYPSRLYKYFPPERVDVLESAMLRYSPLGSFNDPFEGRPDITNIATAERTVQLIEELLPEVIAEASESLPTEEMRAAWSEISTTLIRRANSERDAFLQSIQQFTPLVKAYLSQRFDEHIGACCFSAAPDSLLMWSHYAASHTGFVIEFDGEHSYFHEQRSHRDELRHIRRVHYRSARPTGVLSDLEGTDMFFVKSDHWSYEQEWRILRSLADATQVAPSMPHPIHLFRFPLEAMCSVILGARICPDTEMLVKGILRNDDRSHVKIRRAALDTSLFRLSISD